ncbi:MAG: fasciclin domain-containing protein [Chryseolinea sp.]
MKTSYYLFTCLLSAVFACGSSNTNETAANPSLDQVTEQGGQSNVKDDDSQKNIVQVAISSPDHTTLVAALKAATYVDALSNAGPFTVFAPTDAAFKKLPEGTLEDLLKPENKDKLRNILEYHVYVGVIRENMIRDGMILNQVNGSNITLNKAGDKVMANKANVIGVMPGTNGIIYVIDQSLGG